MSRVPTTFALDAETRAWVEAAARKSERSRSFVVRTLIRRAIAGEQGTALHVPAIVDETADRSGPVVLAVPSDE